MFGSDATSLTGWEYSGTGSWFTLGDPAAVFPLPGFIEYNGSWSGPGKSTDIWNAHHDKDVPGKAYGQYIYEGPKSVRSAQNKARGGSVRCIAEELDPFTNEPGMPVMGSYSRFVYNASDVEELSGLCWSRDGDFLWGVGDEGSVYKLDFEGGATKHWYHDADMEDVTIDPATGDMYVAIEGSQKIYRIPAPDYNTYSTAFYVQEAVDMNIGNSGLEGITYYKDGMVFIGCQYGANLWTYKLDGTKVSRIQLGTLARGITEVGGLYYDSSTDMLWVADSEAFKLFVFDGDLTKQLAEYDISFIGNPESVCVDHERSCVWVGDDGSTSKLYKIKFTNL